MSDYYNLCVQRLLGSRENNFCSAPSPGKYGRQVLSIWLISVETVADDDRFEAEPVYCPTLTGTPRLWDCCFRETRGESRSLQMVLRTYICSS